MNWPEANTPTRTVSWLGMFSGEEMTCVICGRRERSDPRVESQWRAVRVNEAATYYFCPAEFPPDELGTRHLFSLAYQRAFLAALLVDEGRPLHQGPHAEVFGPIDWRDEATDHHQGDQDASDQL